LLAVALTMPAAHHLVASLARLVDGMPSQELLERTWWNLALFAVVTATSACVIQASRISETWCRRGAIATCLTLLTLVVRVPYFDLSQIDGDESAFIMMGQSILDGHLPYTALWDVKPPLLFAVFATLIAAGKDIVFVRLGGALCVAGAAVLLYACTRRIHGATAAAWAALFTIIADSAIESGQATMSEHILLPVLCGLLVVLTLGRPPAFMAALAGNLLGAAILIRTNAIYLAPGVAFALWRRLKGERPEKRRRLLCLCGVCASMPLVTLVAIYAIDGEATLLARSLVLAPLALDHIEPTGIMGQFGALASQIQHNLSTRSYLLTIGFVVGLAWQLRESYPLPPPVLTILVLETLMLASIMAMSSAHPHYFIQMVPFVAVGAGGFVAALQRSMTKWILVPPLVGAFLLPLTEVATEYRRFFPRVAGSARDSDDGAKAIATYLVARGATGRYIFVCGGPHIVYWLAGARSATLFADPSYLTMGPLMTALRGPGASSVDELQRTLSRRPEFVVEDGACTDDPIWNATLAAELASKYERIAVIEGVIIHKRFGAP
jgi:hypothetical protein